MPYKEAFSTLGDDKSIGTLFPSLAPIKSRAYIAQLIRLDAKDRGDFAKIIAEVTDIEIDQSSIDTPEKKRELIALLKEKYPDIAEKLSTLYPFRIKQFEEQRERIQNIFGVDFTEKGIAEIMNRSDDEALIARVRASVISYFAHLGPDEQSRIDRMEGLGRDVNRLIEDVARRFFPGYEMELDQSIEVTHCNSPAELFLMTLDEENCSPTLRFEAKRKLELMSLFLQRKSVIRDRRDALNEFNRLLSRHLFKGKKGKFKKQYLRAMLETEDDYRVSKGKLFVDDYHPEYLEDDQICIPVELREIEATDEDGNKQIIDIYVDSREKDKNSQILKMIRKDTNDMEALLGDLNGVRVVCKTEQELELLKKTLIERLESAGYDVEPDRVMDKIGTKENNGTIDAKKFNLKMTSPNGKKWDFEIQTFTWEQFVNYDLQIPVAWPMYEIQRFFDNSVSETLFPEEIYKIGNRNWIAFQAWMDAHTNYFRSYRKAQIKSSVGPAPIFQKFRQFRQQELQAQESVPS